MPTFRNPDALVWAYPALAALGLLIGRLAPAERRRMRFAWTVFAAGLLAAAASMVYPAEWLTAIALAFAQLAGIHFGVTLLFHVALRRFGLPHLAGDLLVGVGYVVVALSTLSAAGVNVQGLIATSAVATAMIGFALQDILSNLASGVTLQLERSIREGDWLKTPEGMGQVRAMRMRHTAIETPDGDTILLPNGLLTRSAVTVLGRGVEGEAGPVSHRVLVGFHLPYSIQPPEVVRAVDEALAASPIAGVDADPHPRCVVTEYRPGQTDYGVLAWISRPAMMYVDLSELRLRIYYALARLGAPLVPITYVVEQHARADPATDSGGLAALAAIDLFHPLDAAERADLAARLRVARYAPGEVILREGDPGDSMFLIARGSAEVSLGDTGVATLGPGAFFGEMSLLTGEPRSATVRAGSLLECFVLEKSMFAALIEKRTELAGELSTVLEGRRAGLAEARERMAAAAAPARADLLSRIRAWFKLA